MILALRRDNYEIFYTGADIFSENICDTSAR